MHPANATRCKDLNPSEVRDCDRRGDGGYPSGEALRDRGGEIALGKLYGSVE